MVAGVIGDLDIEGIRAVATALAESGVAGQVKRASRMTAWLGEDEDGRCSHIDRLVDALFTSELAPLAERSLSNKDIRADFPNVVIVQQAAQQAAGRGGGGQLLQRRRRRWARRRRELL